MFIGTVVTSVESSSTPQGHEAILFSATEFNNKFGRFFNPSKDFVGVMNADGNADNFYIDCVTYYGNSGNLCVGVQGG